MTPEEQFLTKLFKKLHEKSTQNHEKLVIKDFFTTKTIYCALNADWNKNNELQHLLSSFEEESIKKGDKELENFFALLTQCVMCYHAYLRQDNPTLIKPFLRELSRISQE